MLGADLWQYRHLMEHEDGADVWSDADHRGALDLTGFAVEALDGSIGKVDRASYEIETSAIVVDTGPWIFGRKVLIPAGIIDRIDEGEETVRVPCTRDVIKGSPPYDDTLVNDEQYRTALERYYGRDKLG